MLFTISGESDIEEILFSVTTLILFRVTVHGFENDTKLTDFQT